MALTELERQKDSISWEPISERADFITTLSYKRGSTIPWRRTLQKSFIKQDQTLSPHCPMTIQLFNTVSYQNTLYKRVLCSRSRLYHNIAVAYKRGSSHFGGGVEEKTAIVELLLKIQGFIFVAKKSIKSLNVYSGSEKENKHRTI